MRIARGMIGTGLTFSVGVAIVGSVVGGLALLLTDVVSLRDVLEIVGRCSVIAFPVGAAFGAILAISARLRTFTELSLPRFAAMGAAAGLVLFALISINGIGVWTAADAVANLAILTLMGAASASAVALLARRSAHALPRGDDTPALAEGTSPVDQFGNARSTREPVDERAR